LKNDEVKTSNKERTLIMNNLTEAAKAGGKRMTTFGVIAIILGMLAMLAPGLTGVSIAMLLGGLVVVSGIVRMTWAFQSGSLGRGLWMFVIGGLTLLCGIALLANPLFASGVLTIVLAVYFVSDGISEIAAGFGRMGDGGGWLLFSGIVSIILGAMIWAQYPLSGAWAMGTLLGIKLFFVGLTMITGGSAVRSMATT
jgi:uncharacterized membrane protein HdeD (DUF308 family)